MSSPWVKRILGLVNPLPHDCIRTASSDTPRMAGLQSGDPGLSPLGGAGIKRYISAEQDRSGKIVPVRFRLDRPRRGPVRVVSGCRLAVGAGIEAGVSENAVSGWVEDPAFPGSPAKRERDLTDHGIQNRKGRRHRLPFRFWVGCAGAPRILSRSGFMPVPLCDFGRSRRNIAA